MGKLGRGPQGLGGVRWGGDKWANLRWEKEGWGRITVGRRGRFQDRGIIWEGGDRSRVWVSYWIVLR